MDRPAPNPELLLRDSGWMRGLARRLVGDEELADDVAQESWIASWRAHGDAIDRAERAPWLAGIVRNLARRALRARERRRERELRADPARAFPSPDEIAELESTRQQVVRALLALAEPYRTTLLLRYYEGLEPIDIARRLGLPAPTVRTRLRRGLALLRAELGTDRRARGAFAPALARLAEQHGSEAGWGARAASAPVFSAAVKGTLMTWKVSAGLAGVLLVLLACWFGVERWNEASGGNSNSAPHDVALSSEPQRALEEPHALSGEAQRALAMTPSAPQSAGASWTLAIERARGALHGGVRDLASQRPLAQVEIEAVAEPGALPEGVNFAEDRSIEPQRTRTAADGSFRFDALPRGPYRLFLRAPDGRTQLEHAAASERDAFVSIDLGTDPRHRTISSEIHAHVEDATGRPVANVEVTALLASGGRSTRRTTTTDEHGDTNLLTREIERGLLFARSAQGVALVCLSNANQRSRFVRTLPDENGAPRNAIVMVLSAPGSIAGSVRDAHAGARVSAWAESWPQDSFAAVRHAERATIDDTGRFAFASLAPGRYLITLEGDPGRCLPLVRQTVPEGWPLTPELAARLDAEREPLRVEVRAGEVTRIELEPLVAATLSGRVTELGSPTPIAGASVRVVLPHGLASDPDSVRRHGVPLWRLDACNDSAQRSPIFARETRTDADGRYRFDDLLPAHHARVEVQCAGWSFDRRVDLTLAAGANLELRHELSRAGGIQGVARSWETLGVRELGSEPFLIVFTSPREADATFSIPGLRAGRYEICAVHSDDGVEPTPLERVEVRAGELTWIDLRESSPYVARGRILMNGSPLAGALVDFHGPRQRTDGEGRFAVRRSFPPRGASDFTVLAREPDSVRLHVRAKGLVDPSGIGGDVDLRVGEIDVQLDSEHGQSLDGLVTLHWRSAAGQSPGAFGLGGDERVDSVELDWRGVERTLDADGRARFTCVPAGTYELSGEAGGGAIEPLVFELARAEHRSLTVSRARGGKLEALALDRTGRPYGGADLVFSLRASDSSRQFARRRTGVDGRAELACVPPGTVEVLWLDAGTGVERVEASVEVQSGSANAITLRQPR